MCVYLLPANLCGWLFFKSLLKYTRSQLQYVSTYVSTGMRACHCQNNSLSVQIKFYSAVFISYAYLARVYVHEPGLFIFVLQCLFFTYYCTLLFFSDQRCRCDTYCGASRTSMREKREKYSIWKFYCYVGERKSNLIISAIVAKMSWWNLKGRLCNLDVGLINIILSIEIDFEKVHFLLNRS